MIMSVPEMSTLSGWKVLKLFPDCPLDIEYGSGSSSICLFLSLYDKLLITELDGSLTHQ